MITYGCWLEILQASRVSGFWGFFEGCIKTTGWFTVFMPLYSDFFVTDFSYTKFSGVFNKEFCVTVEIKVQPSLTVLVSILINIFVKI